MTATAAPQPKTQADLHLPSNGKQAYVSWETFQKRYLAREDGHTYEWTNGKIEKTPNTMDISQFYIWLNLNRFFLALAAQNSIAGSLTTEVDVFLDEETHRRPDICFLTHAQIMAARTNRLQVPKFVIEIISPNDRAYKVQQKVQTYFEHGVQVVWNIYPEAKEIHVYEEPSLARIRRGDDPCSAEKVIPGFALAVSEILREG